jgi:hypothetical protein
MQSDCILLFATRTNSRSYEAYFVNAKSSGKDRQPNGVGETKGFVADLAFEVGVHVVMVAFIAIFKAYSIFGFITTVNNFMHHSIFFKSLQGAVNGNSIGMVKSAFQGT